VQIWFEAWHVATPHLTHPDPVELWERRFKDEIFPNETVLVADLDGEAVGFMALRMSDSYVHLLYVSPSVHGRGIGSQLLSEAVRRCPDGLSLRALEANENARRFYERRGWVAGERGQTARTGFPSVTYRWIPQ
jgi:putative acetyltransferase